MKLGYRNRGWCEDEDKLICQLVEKFGAKDWARISKQLHVVYGYSKKTGKQCRQRYHNHLDPHIIKKSWTKNQEDILFQEHKINGNKWTIIAEKLPGRTDNSIKNHFYSTIRKSLRRISKFLGSKNSTLKMRQIKPSTLTKIFSLAQGTPNQQKQTKQQRKRIEIAQYLINFGRNTLNDKKYLISQQDNKAFQKMLEQISQINKNYEVVKLEQAKIRKQKMLQKKFDDICQSDLSHQEQENLLNSQPIQQQSQNFIGIQKQEQQVFVTRSKRKIKPPIIFQTQIFNKRQKQEGKIKQRRKAYKTKIKQINQQGQLQLQKSQAKQIQNNQNNQKQLINSPIYINCIKYSNQLMINQHQNIIYQKLNEPQPHKFQFLVQINQPFEDPHRSIYQLNLSPGIRNTPMAITPKTYEFMRQLHHQSLTNQQCNIVYNKIMHDIKRNSNYQLQFPEKPLPILSPS